MFYGHHRCFMSTLIGIAFFLKGCFLSHVEEPNYEVVQKFDEFEIRTYPPIINAETVVEGDFAESANVGFRRLANYIFGQNRRNAEIAMTSPVGMTSATSESQKIAMTAPVSQIAQSTNSWRITFTMPSQYSLEELPQPLDPLVVLVPKAAKKYSVLRFSGFNSQANVDEKTTKLRQLAAQQGLALTSQAIYARYNPPWTPWFLRRNEILIELAP